MKQAIDYGALADFRYEIRRFLNFSERAARRAGGEPQQHQALLAIKGRGRASEVTVGALAERLQVRHHTAVELSHRLVTRGLIRRAHSPADHRKVLLRLTPRGARVLHALSLTHQRELRTAAPKLIAALRAALRRGHRGRPRHL